MIDNTLDLLEKFVGYDLRKSTYEPKDSKYKLIIWFYLSPNCNLPTALTAYGSSVSDVVQNALALHYLRIEKFKGEISDNQ